MASALALYIPTERIHAHLPARRRIDRGGRSDAAREPRPVSANLFGKSFLALLALSAASPPLQAGAIVVGTFILEDATTVLTAFRVADRALSASLALLALYSGIALGDLGLYAIGRGAGQFTVLGRYIDRDKVESYRAWLRRHLIRTVLLTRFVPGARLPTYTACGFLRVDFARFSVGVIIATLIWTTLLFSAALVFGDYVLQQLGTWRWAAGLVCAGAVVAFGRVLRSRHAGRAASVRT